MATRHKAREVRRYLVSLGSPCDPELVLDFSGVSAVSPSFADELVNVLLELRCQLRIVGLSDEVLAMVNSVAARRNATVHRVGDGSASERLPEERAG